MNRVAKTKYSVVMAIASPATASCSRVPKRRANRPMPTQENIITSISVMTGRPRRSEAAQAAEPVGDGGVGAVQDYAAELFFFDLVERLVDQRHGGDAGPDDEHHAVGHIGQQHGVAAGQDGRYVKNDHVVALAHLVERACHARGPQQTGGMERRRATW